MTTNVSLDDVVDVLSSWVLQRMQENAANNAQDGCTSESDIDVRCFATDPEVVLVYCTDIADVVATRLAEKIKQL